MKPVNKRPLSWLEISRQNLTHNVRTIRQLIGDDRIYCPAVKGNAYGHGLTEVAGVMQDAGVDWFGVNALFEAEELLSSGITKPIYVMGYIPLADLEDAVNMGVHFVVYNRETLERLAEITRDSGKQALTHLKLETGNFRQGVQQNDLPDMAELYRSHPGLVLEGVATHFANIEDTTDHSYAEKQLALFHDMIADLEQSGLKPQYKHCANSAATILFPKTYFNFVRTGVANYGLWPSDETLISARQQNQEIELKPVLSWKTIIVQIKNVPEGSFIGYGGTYKTTRASRLAVLPVGYYDCYDRKFSNAAYVLIRGKRAPVRGRVAMNMTVVDVTDIPDAALEDEAVLLGAQGSERVTAEFLAQISGTINYEVTTRINEGLERRVV